MSEIRISKFVSVKEWKEMGGYEFMIEQIERYNGKGYAKSDGLERIAVFKYD